MMKTNLEDDNFQEAEGIQLYAGLALGGFSVHVCLSGDGKQGLCACQALSYTPDPCYFIFKIWPGEMVQPVRAYDAKPGSLEPT